LYWIDGGIRGTNQLVRMVHDAPLGQPVWMVYNVPVRQLV
jgi:hypothetical protein